MKDWLKKNKWKIIVPAIIVLALVIAFFAGGSPENAPISGSLASSLPSESTAAPSEETQTNAQSTQSSLQCTLSISCETALANIDRCKPEKQGYIPGDGMILDTVSVEFTEGESVFDVLQRTCRYYGIQLDAEWTAMYNSAYVKGIANLYEKDVGSLSGWMYKVNDWFPNYGCSSYTLQDGDVISFVYTCDLGKDVGGGF